MYRNIMHQLRAPFTNLTVVIMKSIILSMVNNSNRRTTYCSDGYNNGQLYINYNYREIVTM